MNLLNKIYKNLKNSEFVSNFKILAFGTLISQMIMLLSSPLITRIYSPEEFGVFALFTSIVSIFIPVSSLRYNTAIVIANSNNESNDLIVVSILIAILFAFLIFLFTFFGEIYINKILDVEKLKVWWNLIFFAILIQSLNLIIRNYLNRYKKYNLISKLSIIRSIIYVLVVIFFGYFGYSKNGLFFGEILAALTILIFAIIQFKPRISYFKSKITYGLVHVIKKYKDFPTYSFIASFLDKFTVMMPIFFLSKYFPEFIVGQYSLAVKVIFFPLSFVSSSISTIHLRKSKEIINQNGNLKKYLYKLTLLLVGIIFIPALILFFFGPEIFSFMFGNKWQTAGEFIQILIPALALIFVVSTLSPLLNSIRKLHLYSYWNYSYFFFLFSFFYFFSSQLEIKNLLLYFSIINTIMYGIYFFLIWYSIKDYKSNMNS